MKRLIIAISLFIAPVLVRGATQPYIPSTNTFQTNGVINIATGTIRIFNASTATITNLSISSVTISTLSVTEIRASSGSISLANLSSTGAVVGTMTITGLNLSSGSLTAANFASTGAVIGTMTVTGMSVTESTFTRAMVGISTITNGAINNANLGSVASTGTWTFSTAVLNGTKTDNSTTTITAPTTFTGLVSISSIATVAVGGTTVLSVNQSSVTLSTQTFIKGLSTNADVPTGYNDEITTATASAGFVNAAPTTQFTGIATMTLTAGQYIIIGTINQNLNGATITRAQMAISLSQNNSTGDQVNPVNNIDLPLPTAAASPGGTITLLNFRTTVTTIVYLKYEAAFTGGPPQALGFMQAIRR